MCELISQQVGLHVSLWAETKPQIPREHHKTRHHLFLMRQHYHPFPHTFFFPLFKQGSWWAPFQQMCTYTSSDPAWRPATALQGAVVLPSKSFTSPCFSTFAISEVHLIHSPWRSLQGFVKQNTSPLVTQWSERRECSKDKATGQAETWRDVCGVKLKLFDSPFSSANNAHNLILLLHFNFHCLEKNVPFYLLSVLHPVARDTANKH